LKKVIIFYSGKLTNKFFSMRKLLKPLFAVIASGLLIASCSKEERTESMDIQLTDETLAQISAMGFSPLDVQVVDGKYLVEGDILISPSELGQRPTSPRLRIAETEQYRTFNLVTGLPRTITVSTSGNIPADLSTGIDAAIERYNAEDLALNFARVPSNGNINIRVVRTAQFIASAGFPTGGNPYNEIQYSSRYAKGYSQNFITTVLTHEMGHCIGFRHTDYMNRSFSCGSGGNEGQETNGVGAVHIPGTPTSPDAGSWMLACLSASTNRPFNGNDKVALNYLY
jgi:hypothetical protein